MSCSELTKLVKAYTNGEIPLEIYREQRRQIVDNVVDGPKPKQKNDPLDAFIASAPQKTPGHGKFPAIYLTVGGAVLAIGIASMLLFSNNHDSEPSASSDTTAAPENKSQAQQLVDNFLNKNQWNEEAINQFVLDWQILSPADRQNAQNTVWFSRFKSIIQNLLDKQKSRIDKTNTLSEDLLTSLLVTVDPGHFIRQPFFTEESRKPVDKPKIESVKPAQPIVASAEKTPPAPGNSSASESAKESLAVKQKAAPSKTVHSEKALDYVKLNSILSDFIQSFQTGNLTALMHLFSQKATTNYHTSATEISNSYYELFQSTATRELQFSDFNWKPTGNKIEGNGKYLAHLNPKGTNVDQIFSADVSITVDNSGESPLIVGLYLNNQQFSTSLRQSAKTAPQPQTPPPPEKEELRILLTNFVTAYNRGNIDALMTLFSQEARTNDRSNINDIRDDYEQLFKTTRSREIILTKIVWDVDGNKAVANGLFEARIRPLSGGEMTVYKGKIRFGVTKFEGGILITQLLHNTF